MRPIELEVRGFTCFRTPAHIDFRGLDLFAITGPTGAGKTSLIEAMIYALYGRSPRVSNEIRHLLAMGSDKALVDLSFSIGKGEYRVIRTFSKKGQTEARLDQREKNGSYQSLASGSREVSATTERLLGLDYGAFVRTVVLPQGRFDEFLKGQASDRQRILTTLLDFRIYEKMRKRASETFSQASTRLKDIRSRLEEIGEVSKEALKEETQNSKQIKEDITRIELEKKETETQEKLAKETLALSQTLEQVEKKLDGLSEKSAFFTSEKVILQKARQAVPLLPLWESLSQLKKRLSTEENAQNLILESYQNALETVKTCQEKKNLASLEAKQVSLLKKEIENLREASGFATLLESQKKELTLANTKVQTANEEFIKAKEELDTTQTRVKRAKEERETLLTQQKSLEQNPEILSFLKETKRAEEEFVRTRRAFQDAEKTYIAAQKEQKQSEKEEETQNQIFAEAKNKAQHIEELLQKTQTALELARRENNVGFLRKHLRTGDICPVCESEVGNIIQKPLPTLEKIEKEFQEAKILFKDKNAKKETAAKNLREVHAKAAASLVYLEGSHKNFLESKQRKEERLERLETCLRTLKEVGQTRQENTPLDDLQKKLTVPKEKERLSKTLDAITTHLETQAKILQEIEEKVLLSEKAKKREEEKLARIDERVKNAEKEFQQTQNNKRRLQKEVDALQNRLNAFGGDPKALLLQKNQQKEQLLRSEEKANTELTLANARLQDLKEQVDAAKKRVKNIEKEFSQNNDNLLPRLEEAGFSDPEQLKKAMLSQEEISTRSMNLASYEAKQTTLLLEKEQICKEIGDQSVDAVQVSQLEQRAKQLEQDLRQLTVQDAVLGQRIIDLQKSLQRKQILLEEEAEHKKEQERFGSLVHDLRSDEFQAYVLDEAFRFLAEDGSRQLHRLSSERYTFLVKDREFYVLDHWNAAEPRPVRTLSGGETFLASLALSVALAERIHDLSTTATGDRVLESLFLDEGFGTLDPEALDIVLSALEELRTSGRMVGVISHVTELTARLPSRIILERSSSGSVLTQEGGG